MGAGAYKLFLLIFFIYFFLLLCFAHETATIFILINTSFIVFFFLFNSEPTRFRSIKFFNLSGSALALTSLARAMALRYHFYLFLFHLYSPRDNPGGRLYYNYAIRRTRVHTGLLFLDFLPLSSWNVSSHLGIILFHLVDHRNTEKRYF